MISDGLFAADVAQELSQGDVFHPNWDIDRAEPIGPVVVLSHDCEIDKSPTTLVAQIELPANTPDGLLGHIKSGRVWHALWLGAPAIEGWINFRTIRPIETALLLSRTAYRVASMTVDGRDLLTARILGFLTRGLPS